MKKPKIFEKAANTAAKVKFKVSKHSPEILLVAGVVGVVAGTVAACKATTKVSKIRKEQTEQLDAIEKAKADGEICIEDEDGDVVTVDYTKKDAKKDALIVYKNSAVEYVKLYFPSVVILTLSIGSIIASHGTLKKRGLAAAAAYGAIDKSFKDYRRRVVDRFGPEVDKELRYGVRTEAVTKEEVNEKGKKRKVTVAEKSLESLDFDKNDYIVSFGEGTSNAWRKDTTYNVNMLKIMWMTANRKLEAQGYLFLNDLYDILEMPEKKSAVGRVVGWIYDKRDPRYNGINRISFGIYDFDELERNMYDYETNYSDDFENRKKAIILEFNPDGIIYDKIEYVQE